MKKQFLAYFFLFLGMAGILQAQKTEDKDILLIVGTDTTTKGEFYKTYAQNLIPGRVSEPDRQELENYLQLYINFRLKVMAAKDAGYDTVRLLQQELDSYRTQLGKPYVTDRELAEALFEETYRNMQSDVFARHILIALPRYPSPADTLAAYKKAMKVRNSIMKGADFCDMVIQYSSDYRNPAGKMSLAKTGREGELGYFTALGMVYPFEHAVYGLKVGELSMPVRTKYGYHLIQLMDKRPALGKVTASHIMLGVPSVDTTEALEKKIRMRIDSVYADLQNGGNFAELAVKYSDDKYTAMRGGSIGTFTVNRMVPELIEQLYALNEGEYSKPFRSRFGWHIVRLDKKTGVDTYENLKSQIAYSFDNDSERDALALRSFQKKCLKEDSWAWNKKVVSEVRKYFSDTVYINRLPKEEAENPTLFSKTILVYENDPKPVWDFIDFLKTMNRRGDIIVNVSGWLDEMFDEYLGSTATRHAFSLLEERYPEFAAMMDEYRDGVYLFDINNRKVWGKAVSDSLGLAAFFETHRDDYMHPEKAVATVVAYDVTQANTSDVKKFMNKAVKKNWNAETLKAEAEKKFGKGVLSVDSAAYAKGDNVFLDNMIWIPGLSKDILSGSSQKAFVMIHAVQDPVPCELDEVRGTVISDYQGYLETEWIKELRRTYKVTVNQDVFESLLPSE